MPREAQAPPLPQPRAPEQQHFGPSGPPSGPQPLGQLAELWTPAPPVRASGTVLGAATSAPAPAGGRPASISGGLGPRAEPRPRPRARPGGLAQAGPSGVGPSGVGPSGVGPSGVDSISGRPTEAGPTMVIQSPGGFLAKTAYRAEPARPFALMIAVGGVITVLAIAAGLAFWPGRATSPTSADQGTTAAALPPPAPVPTNDTPPAPVAPKPKKVVKPVPKPVTPVPTKKVEPVPEPAPVPPPAPVPDPNPGPNPNPGPPPPPGGGGPPAP